MPVITEIPADLLAPAEIVFKIGRRHITSPQPYTAHLRASGPTDERWIAEIKVVTKDKEALDRLESLFDIGDGLAGYYSAFDPVHSYPAGTATGLVSPYAGGSTSRFSDGGTFSDGGLFQTGITQSTIGVAASKGAEWVTLAGLVASQTDGFVRGDMIAIEPAGTNAGFLHRIVANASTDASGNATVRIRPRLRQAVAVNQVARFLQPRGVFRLAEEDAMTFSRGPGGLGEPVLSLVEVPEALL